MKDKGNEKMTALDNIQIHKLHQAKIFNKIQKQIMQIYTKNC